MLKTTLKFIFPLIVFILSLLFILASSILSFEKKRENAIIYQRILAEQKAQREKIETEEKIYLMGKFDQTQRKDFALIPRDDTLTPDKIYLRKETLEAFLKMKKAADKNGVDLKIASATRNFDYQKDIWNKKWETFTSAGLEKFKEILEYSSAPGTSRHHWGTEIDINGVNPPYFETKKGEKEYAWLVKNASIFGFCQPYTKKDRARPAGYNEEKWHWSYLPLSQIFTREYKDLIKEEDIKGFLGEEYVTGQNLINNYVTSINPECL